MTFAKTIATITDATRNAPEIHALFLSGSYGNGMADATTGLNADSICQIC